MDAERDRRTANRLAHLDFMRGAAAVLVCIGHLRSFLFLDFASIASPNLFEYAFYFITALGHQSVIVFFALSGYLVGGRAARSMAEGRFTWPEYILRRLTRLWTVVIPALLLTFLLDAVGRALSGGAGYNGLYFSLLNSGPMAPAGADDSLFAFVGNVLFVQTIVTPVFGTNTPLWSLANEFWYYLMFPLSMWTALSSASLMWRVASAAAALAIAICLPFDILLLGLIWLLGAAAFWLAGSVTRLRRGFFLSYSAIAVVFLFSAFAASLLHHGLSNDLMLGAALAAILPVVARFRTGLRSYAVMSRGLSEFSYTLYLVHFPLLAFIVFAWLTPRQWRLDLASATIFAALLIATILFAQAFWWCFERNTDRVRETVRTLIARQKLNRASH
jgi:peptidoglycan/LPS O-acetylase OafA/YrhL